MPILHVEVPAAPPHWSLQSRYSTVRIPYPSSRTDNKPAVAKVCDRSNSPRRGKTCVCPMVVSQWGLNSKNNRGKTSPGHSMVVSQWSSPERRFPAHPGLQLRPPGKMSACKQCLNRQPEGRPHTQARKLGLGDCTLVSSGPSRAKANKVRRQGDVRAHITFGSLQEPKISMVYTAFV